MPAPSVPSSKAIDELHRHPMFGDAAPRYARLIPDWLSERFGG